MLIFPPLEIIWKVSLELVFFLAEGEFLAGDLLLGELF
jgi:hypothetical protein